MSSLRTACGCLVAAAFVIPVGVTAQVPIATSPDGDVPWAVDAQARATDGKIESYLGRTALWLRNNSVIFRPDIRFLSGTIEFDIAPMPGANFAGVVFRRQSEFEEENLYLRPPRSGQFDAAQYAPHVNRQSTWQLYPQFSEALALPAAAWTHLKLDVDGVSLRVFANGASESLISVPRLRGGFGVGRVGFWARVNGAPQSWAAAVSNVSIHADDADAKPRSNRDLGATSPGNSPLAGSLVEWEVAGPVPTDSLTLQRIPASGWTRIATEENGLLNLTRALGDRRGRWTAFLRTTITAERAEHRRLDLAYSDDAEVELNGVPLYGGVNGWQSRYPGYLGLVQFGNEWLNPSLKKGRNELRIRLSDDGRFGWGLMARLRSDDRDVSQAVGVDLSLRRRELLAADSAYGARKEPGIARRLSEPLSADAMVIGPGNTLWRGTTAVYAALLKDTLNAHATITWAPIRGDVSADGSHGYTFGYLDFDGSESPRRFWKYLAYWERDSAGRWTVRAYKRLPRESGAHQSIPPAGFALPVNRTAKLFAGDAMALAQFMALDTAFARAAQTDVVKAFQRYTAPDGATLSGSANIAWGPARVATEFAAFVPGAIDWAPDHAMIAPGGDLGFATGEVIVREKKPDGKFVEVGRGRYLTIWKRGADGSWKLIIDG